MSLISAVAGYLNPYSLQLKIAAAVIALCGLIGAGLYIRHVFNDRARLQAENGGLATKLSVEEQKYASLLQQSQQLMATNQQIVEAVKRVKINSSIYIDRVEASRLAPAATGGTVLVPGGVPKADPAAGGMPILKPYSSR